MEDRLQKILARAGYGSRRNCELLISSGRVTVNGKLASLGSKANPTKDKILLDGKAIIAVEEFVYVMIYKPRNVLSAVKAPDTRQVVRDLIPLPGTLFPVGRLDVDSEGLLLLTNDGDLANRLTHPRYEHEKEYRVLVARHPDEDQLAAWKRGVVLEDGFQTQPAEVYVVRKQGKGAWLSVILKEGHKRQIREVGRVTGLPVVKIIRIRMGTLQLGKLRPRQWRHLTAQEISALKS
jgi:23S rRNA pseudouridine2605 synthase